MASKAIDVSSAQGNYAVGSNGEDIIITKVTEGTGYVNPNFNHVASQAKAQGKPLGIYHWVSPGIDPIAQANYFIANAGSYFDIAVPILDCEEKGITAAQVQAMVNHIINTKHVTPMIYASAGADGFNVTYFKGTRVPNQCALWLAGYPYQTGTTHEIVGWIEQNMPYSIAPWSKLAGWQFTSNGIDRSWFYIDPGAWLTLKGGDGINNHLNTSDSKEDDSMKLITITTDGDYYGTKYPKGATFLLTGDSIRYIERPTGLGALNLLAINRYSIDAGQFLLIMQDLNLKIS